MNTEEAARQAPVLREENPFTRFNEVKNTLEGVYKCLQSRAAQINGNTEEFWS